MKWMPVVSKSIWSKGFLSIALCAVSALAQAQSGTPIKIITPFTAGTGYDTIARAVGTRLAEKTGVPVVVQNMPGASGNIGTDAAAKSAPDGNTILMGGNTMLISSQLYKDVSFHPLKDFSPVTLAATGTLMLVAHPKINVKSVQELVKLAQAKPGYVTFGSPGIGTPHHMAMELFKLETKTFMLHVPYRGTAGYTQDLLAGELMTGFLPVHIAQGFVKTGKLVALGLGSAQRHPVAPDVPTFAEVGYKNIDVDLWYAFFVPAKTPSATVTRLNSEIASIIREPHVKEILTKVGLDARATTPDELGSMAQRDYQRWGNVIRAKNIVAD
jgi:tripartite-type tricarboxylate transporter receptor subunit TctC